MSSEGTTNNHISQWGFAGKHGGIDSKYSTALLVKER